jgi:hypothetical protein
MDAFYPKLEHRRDWAVIWLGVLAITSVLGFLVNSFSISLLANKVEGNEYIRGKIYAQTKANEFIRQRIGADQARLYRDWLVK